jgi:2-polyprenyl-3-methyl-5-hydroxy-6-metoxy-1,4-benzoquinol methylase
MTPRTTCPACDAPVGRVEHFEDGDIFICSRCRLQWARRRASAIDNAYASDIHQRYMDPRTIDPPGYAPFRDFFERIEPLLGHGRRLLDVGCGNGTFMAEAARRGFDVWGVDIDRRLAEVIPPALADRVVFEPIEQAVGSLPDQVDVITFNDSFEHIDEPYALLEALRPRLAPGGIVFLRVNNVHDVFNYLTRMLLPLSPPVGRRLLKSCFNLPQHAWNFSRAGMVALLARHGWRVVSHRVTETPASRLSDSPPVLLAIRGAYLVNRLISGGKIGEYVITPMPEPANPNR